jgi:beta-mannanase
MLGLYSSLPGLTSAQSIAMREKQLGRTIPLHHSFYSWDDSFPGPAEADDAAHGRTPVITWWGYYFSAINDGSQDALIRARADAVRDYHSPIYLAWGAEMNLAYPPWPNVHNPFDPAGFIASWRRIHDIFRQEGATNVVWVWAPNSESNPGGTDPASPNNWKHYYPGDAYVDWVGADGYNWGHYGLNQWRSLASFLGAIYRDYAGHKPFMILETAANAFGGDKGAWLDQSRAWIETHPGIRAFVYFDQDSASDRDWRIDSPPSALAAFQRLARDPAFAR